jgi:hypothetical protein
LQNWIARPVRARQLNLMPAFELFRVWPGEGSRAHGIAIQHALAGSVRSLHAVGRSLILVLVSGVTSAIDYSTFVVCSHVPHASQPLETEFVALSEFMGMRFLANTNVDWLLSAEFRMHAPVPCPVAKPARKSRLQSFQYWLESFKLVLATPVAATSPPTHGVAEGYSMISRLPQDGQEVLHIHFLFDLVAATTGIQVQSSMFWSLAVGDHAALLATSKLPVVIRKKSHTMAWRCSDLEGFRRRFHILTLRGTSRL